MKTLIIVFAVCGFTCCLGVPPCTVQEIEKCPKAKMEYDVLTEDDLNQFCKQLKCFLEFGDRCGVHVYGYPIPFPTKADRRMYNDVCFKPSETREKFLNNAKCIKGLWDSKKNILVECGIFSHRKDEACKKFPSAMKCLVDYVTRKCGQDAGDVYQIVNPGLDYYDCAASE